MTACRVLGQHRFTQRKIAKPLDDEASLAADITALAVHYGCNGYRRVALDNTSTAALNDRPV